MAELERLIVRLEADTTRLRRELQRGDKAVATSTARMNRSLRAVDGSMGGLGQAAVRLRGVLLGLGVAFGAREFIQAADRMKLLSSRLKLVTGSAEELEAAQRALFDISQETFGSFEGSIEIYARLARGAKDLHLSQADLLGVTRAVNQAVLVSGATAQEARAAIIQFSQGIASGTLRGEELRSVLEQMPRLAQALAAGLGVSIGKLRELGAAGALTTEAVVEALKTQFAALEAEAANMERTTGQAFQQLENSLLRSIGLAQESSDGLSRLGEVLDELRAIVDGEDFKSGMGALIEALGFIATKSAEAIQQIGGLATALRNLDAGKFFEVLDQRVRSDPLGGLILGARPGVGGPSAGQLSFAMGPGGGAFGSGRGGLSSQFGRMALPARGGPGAAAGSATAGAGGGSGALTGGPMGAAALKGVVQKLDAIRAERAAALKALSHTETAWMQSTGRTVALIRKRKEAALAALAEMALTEQEKAQLRVQINQIAEAELAELRRSTRDVSVDAVQEQIAWERELGNAISEVGNSALLGQMDTWRDWARVALNSISRVLQQYVALQQAQGVGGGKKGGIFGQLLSFIPGLFGAGIGAASLPGQLPGTGGVGAGLGSHATGGMAMAGQPAIVGERGPELFVPKIDGRVMTAGETASALRGRGSGNTSVNVYQAPVTINGTNIQPAELARILKRHREETVALVADKVARGGSYSSRFR